MILVALLVALIPTTIGALLSAIGIAGMDRLVQRNVLAMSGRAVEAAGDVNTLLLDKTGTITIGNRQATEFLPVNGVSGRGTGERGAAVQHGRLHPGGPLHRRAGQERVRPPRAQRGRTRGRGVRRVHRADPDERHRPGRRQASAQGRRLVGGPVGPRQRRHHAATNSAGWSTASRRSAARRWWWPSGPTAPPVRSASSTSRTSSRRASPSGSPRCARWASAPS